MTVQFQTKPKYYVYAHCIGTKRLPRYIGKGCGKRAFAISGRSTYWNRKVKKYGNLRVKILHDNLDEMFALWLENMYIFAYGRENLSEGTLINQSDGGEGTSGYLASVITKKRMSLAHTGRKASEETKRKKSMALKGRPLSEENKKNLSLARKGKPGHIMSEDTKEKIRQANIGKKFSKEHRKNIGIATKKTWVERKKQHSRKKTP